MTKKTVCFIGHRNLAETEELKGKLVAEIEALITEKGVDTFLFGSKSQFDSLCYALVTRLKEKYPHVKRVYVRAEYPFISEHYEDYLLESYEETYYPESVLGAGRAVYIKRNEILIQQSDYCVFYFDSANLPAARKSGTKIALDYAAQKGKEIIVFPTIYS